MVKVKRISPEEDVTLEITAPKEAWVCLAARLPRDPPTSITSIIELYAAVRREFGG